MDFRRIPRRNRKECFRFLENALDRAYHNNVQIFRKWYFRFLPSKPEVIVPVWCDIEWINKNFPKTNFSWENLLVQWLLRCAASTVLCWISGLGETQQVILKFDFVKSDSKFGSWYQLPLLAYSVGPIKSAVEILKQCEEPQKIAARFKQNLKIDGYESRYDISSMGSLWK